MASEELTVVVDDDTLEQDFEELALPFASEQRSPYLLVLAGQSVGVIHRLERRVTVLGRAQDCDISLGDDGVSRRHARLVLRSDHEVRLEDLKSTNGTFVGATRVEGITLQDGDRFSLGGTTLFKFSLADEVEERFQRRLYEAAVFDSLTGLFNRKHFIDHLAAEISFSARHGTSLTLMLLDLDHFKEVNDTLGHQAGDRVLQATGKLLRQVVRTEDTVARYGGEEFAILARAISREQALALGERVRRTFEVHETTWERSQIRVTASIGIACFDVECIETVGDLLTLADGALYAAKDAGRNRVIIDR